MRPARVLRSGLVLKPSTLFHFHKLLTKQKYRLLFSPRRVRRPGPKGPTKELIDAVVEMKRRNPTWGCKRIAQQIGLSMRIGDITNFRSPELVENKPIPKTWKKPVKGDSRN